MSNFDKRTSVLEEISELSTQSESLKHDIEPEPDLDDSETGPIDYGVKFIAILAALILAIVCFEVSRLVIFSFELSQLFGLCVSALVGAGLAYLGLLGVRFVAAGRQLDGYHEVRRASEVMMNDSAENYRASFLQVAKRNLKSPDYQHSIAQLQTGDKQHLQGKEALEFFANTTLRAKDEKALSLISKESRDVALVIGVSPFATIDMMVILFRNYRLIKQLSTLYGIRPSRRIQYSLLKKVLTTTFAGGATELAISSLLPEFGVNMMTKLSSRAAQGLGAGVMTSRIGLAALEAVRPLAFEQGQQPKVKQILRETFGLNNGTNKADAINFEETLYNKGTKK